MTISNEAVEAAAKALREHNPFLPELQAMDDTPLDEFECCAKIALEAAAPLIQAEALEDAADDCYGDLMGQATATWLRARAAKLRQR